MSPFRSARRALAIVLLVMAGGACNFDEAELIRPGTAVVTAEIDQLRVLSYPVDPAAGDGWIDVLSPDPAVVTEADEYLEDEGARLADGDEPAVRRRLFTARGAGRTLLVEIDCRDCLDGVPATTPAETGIHVWDFVVDPTTSDLSEGTGIAAADSETTRRVGAFVVIVRASDAGAAPLEVRAVDGDLVAVRRIGSHAPEAAADLYVDVFVATAAGTAEIVDPGTDQVYGVRVSG